jgi:nucleotide-binding universal stress UspA family protein
VPRRLAGRRRVSDPNVFGEAAAGETEGALKPLLDEFPEVPTRVAVVEGNAVDVLLGAARRSRLLVLGARRRRGPLSAGAGYAVDGVIAHSPVPVAIVPARD